MEDPLTGDLVVKQLPVLPRNSHVNVLSSIVLQNGTIYLTGAKRCYQLESGIWKEHSFLNEYRDSHSTVTTNSGTFLFGGRYSRNTYEYLPKNSTTWLMGKTKIPNGFEKGCAIAVKSDTEIWLIGGLKTEKRVLSFNVNDHTFQVLDFQLNKGRRGHACIIIPNTKKLLITGGVDGAANPLKWSEIINIDEETITMASPMNSRRSNHGMGFVTINNQERLVIFGGQEYHIVPYYSIQIRKPSTIEIYNTKTEQWETSCIKLNKPRADFD